METDTREERRSALEEFARQSPDSQKTMPVATQQMIVPFEQNPGAKNIPNKRDKAAILADLTVTAAAAGSDWFYRYPVRNKKENRTDWIEGPTIKLANYVHLIYGNCDLDTRVQDLGDSWMIYARHIDYQTGSSTTRPFQQRKSGSRLGGEDEGRRLEIALQIGTSKAVRNVICNALQFYTDFAFEEARHALVDKIGKDLIGYRERTIERVSEHVTIDRVEAVIGRVAKDWLAPDVARVIALMKGVTEGMATLQETFPALEKDKPVIDQTVKLDEFASSSGNDGSPPDGESGEDGSGALQPDSSPGSADAVAHAASADLKNDLISKVIRLANDKEIDVETRIKLLNEQKPDWLVTMPADAGFVEQCFITAEQLAKGTIKTDAARRHLYAARDA